MLARTHLMLEHRAAVITPLKLQLIGVDLAELLGGTHGERRRWVRAE